TARHLQPPFGRQHPTSNILQSVTLEAPIEGAAAQAERLGGLADVTVEAGHRFLDQEAFDVLEAHVLEPTAAVLARAKAEVSLLHQWPLRHQHRALDRVIELAHVAGPSVLEEHLHRRTLKAGEPLAAAL